MDTGDDDRAAADATAAAAGDVAIAPVGAKRSAKEPKEPIVADVITDANLEERLSEVASIRAQKRDIKAAIAPGVRRERCIVLGLQNALDRNPALVLPPVTDVTGKEWRPSLTRAPKQPSRAAVMVGAVCRFADDKGRAPSDSAEDKAALEAIIASLRDEGTVEGEWKYSFKWEDAAKLAAKQQAKALKVIDDVGRDAVLAALAAAPATGAALDDDRTPEPVDAPRIALVSL